MARRLMLSASAVCCCCDARCVARNAEGWAAQHAERHGHRVEVVLEYVMRPSVEPPAAEPLLEWGEAHA